MSLQDTIKKFQTLPPDIQQALSSDEAMAKMEALEGKYNLKLASFVLRAAVREFPLEDLGIVIRKELNLKPEQAGILKDELLDQIFAPVVSYYAEGAEKAAESAEKAVESGIMNKESRMMPPKPPMAPPKPQPISSSVVLSEVKQIEESQAVEKRSFANAQDDKIGEKDDKEEKSQGLSSQIQQNLPPTPYPLPPKLPPQPPKSRSYFYFDAEDEKDVEKFKKHEVVASGRGKEFIERIDKTADEVINHSLVNISDENGKRKLKSYLTAYFRGIRDILQTKEALAKPLASGGMEFNAVTIEKVMALAKEEFHKIHSVNAERKNESGIMNHESSGVEEKKMESVEKKYEASIKNVGNTVEATAENDSRFKIQDARQINIRRERPQVIDTDKPKIAEVRLPSKLTGPLEEIEQISLRDLRRFAQNHQGFADRTLERIKILENESFEKRMMGIAAWRKSLLYQQYLNVIQNSLERNISIPEMIGAVTEAESQNMSLREWQTVNRLNRELKT